MNDIKQVVAALEKVCSTYEYIPILQYSDDAWQVSLQGPRLEFVHATDKTLKVAIAKALAELEQAVGG